MKVAVEKAPYSSLFMVCYSLVKVKFIWGDSPIEGPLFSLVPGKPFMKYMSQGFDLMNVTTVAENVGEFLTVTNKQELQKRTKELLEMIEMPAYGDRKVKESKYWATAKSGIGSGFGSRT